MAAVLLFFPWPQWSKGEIKNDNKYIPIIYKVCQDSQYVHWAKLLTWNIIHTECLASWKLIHTSLHLRQCEGSRQHSKAKNYKHMMSSILSQCISETRSYSVMLFENSIFFFLFLAKLTNRHLCDLGTVGKTWPVVN